MVVDDEMRAAAAAVVDPGAHVADEQLRLIFACCHPAIAPDDRVALTLRFVVGLTTTEIGRLLLVQESTMAARLTRAKKRLASSGIPFATPAAARLDERLDVVATVVYLAFTSGYHPGVGDVPLRVDLGDEAIRLLRVLDSLLPDRAVVRSLLALLLLQHSRRDTRLDADRRPGPAPRPGPHPLAPRRDHRGRRAAGVARPSPVPVAGTDPRQPARRPPSSAPTRRAAGSRRRRPRRDRVATAPAGHQIAARDGVPAAGPHRRRARHRPDRRGHPLVRHRRPVRPARGAHRLPGRPAGPRGRGGRGVRPGGGPAAARRPRRRPPPPPPGPRRPRRAPRPRRPPGQQPQTPTAQPCPWSPTRRNAPTWSPAWRPWTTTLTRRAAARHSRPSS